MDITITQYLVGGLSPATRLGQFLQFRVAKYQLLHSSPMLRREDCGHMACEMSNVYIPLCTC